ncbi:MAG: choice-of-anchor tandem repeat GloVer-containing protein [Limisphaerales bacterium]
MKTRRNLIQIWLRLLALPATVQAQFTYTTNKGAVTITGYAGSIKLSLKSLIAFLCITSASLVGGQTIQTLCSFNGTNGAMPMGVLTLGTDGNFYGTTGFGSGYGYGTVFKVTTNGTLTPLVFFNGNNGANPYAGLTLGTDGNFYGTTFHGGYGSGTVFKVTTNGTLTTLVSFGFFGSPNGWNPVAALTLGTDGNFYGTTCAGGGYEDGTVFKVTTNGTLTTLVSFNGADGYNPQAALTLGIDGNFYGTTAETADGGYGTVFKVTTNGTLTTLFFFDGTNGLNPIAGLTLGTDGNFYGTTWGGGITNSLNPSGLGTVFKVTTNGTPTTLVYFNGSNGAYPFATLTLGTDGNFYGTTAGGGSSNYGTVFEMTTDGTFTPLVYFNGTNGAGPYAALTLGNDGNFYGTTRYGGSGNYGTVFCLVLPPVGPPTLALQFVAGWPQLNLAGTLGKNFVVQYSTNLAGTNWINLLSVTNLSSSPYEFLDPAGVVPPARFYRAFMQ